MTRKIKSIDDILKNRLCTGCGACAALAPDAIEMALGTDIDLACQEFEPEG